MNRLLHIIIKVLLSVSLLRTAQSQLHTSVKLTCVCFHPAPPRPARHSWSAGGRNKYSDCLFYCTDLSGATPTHFV